MHKQQSATSLRVISGSFLLALASATALFGVSSISQAGDVNDRIRITVNQHNLAAALQALAKQNNISIITDASLLEGKYVTPFSGNYSLREALTEMLGNTDLVFEIDKNNTVYIRKAGVDEMTLVNPEGTHFNSTGGLKKASYEADTGEKINRAIEQEQNVWPIEEVLVTASRRAEKLQDVAMSITSVDPQEFVAAGLTSIEDIIDYTPGVNYNTLGNAGFGNITMRGVSQEAFIPVTAIYIDDIPLTTSTPFASGANLLFDGILGDLERVEIIKGPQGTLYGASSMGGLVRYITKDPALEEMRGNLSVDVSSTSKGGINQLYRGMISVPLAEDKLGVTISGFYNDQDGYIDRLDRTTFEVADKNYNTSKIYGFNVTALAMLSDAASVKVTGLYQETQTSGTSQINFDVADPNNIVLAPRDGKYNIAAPDPGFNDIEYEKADITFKYDFDWAELTSVTGYAKYSNPQFADIIPGIESFADFITDSPPGTSKSIPLSVVAASKKFIQEVRLTSPGSETFEWQAGLFYTTDETSNSQLATIEPQGVVINGSSLPSEYKETAAFGNVTWYLTPDFDITAGVRYSDNSVEADFDIGGSLTIPLEGVFKVSDTVTTYLFNARWRVEENTSLYVRAASGYRPAFSNIPVVDAITGQATSAIIDSDSLWSYEVGAKGNMSDGRFSYDVALWTIDWSDFQAAVLLNNLLTGGNSDVGMSSHGFEGTFRAMLTDQFSITTTLAYTRATVDADSAILGAQEGERTRSLPDWTASLQASYNYAIGDIDAVIKLGMRYVGEYNTAFLGDPNKGIGFGLNRQFPIESYLLTDLNGSFSKDRVTLNIYATNLFNEYTFAAGSLTLDGLGSVVSNANIVRPRTIGASLSYSF